MPELQDAVRDRPRRGCRGGILGYPLDALYQEVAYIAYHLHWSLEEVLQMEHRERAIWIREISRINERINGASE